MIEFEKWLQNTFPELDILAEKNSGKTSITTRNQRNTILRRVLLFMNIMAPGMGITRMRRLLGNPCNPVYLGYLIGYCSSCQKNLVPKGERVWDLAKFMVVLVDGYHNVVQTWRAFFLLFNVTIVVSAPPGRYGPSGRRAWRVLSTQNQFSYGPAPILQIFCTFVLIKLSHHLPSQGYLTYPFAIFTCFTVCMVFETFAAQLFVNSEHLYTDWKKELGLTKVNRRGIRALRPMRMKVGSNFIDRGTALVTQDFCINQTVSLLLL
ncbi:hypothetical protein Fcan01_17086 [Folsomia candida]|uniref:Uncharacterized protein n=1 Tax=Folsomia candida TaxID=158441 RepID=A0A226DUB1_FOLCA|nr:hypothetical protein Fcan01_17086 [Folsomia candida]